MIVTLYKKTISRLLIFTACLLLGQLAIAQQYPVQLVPQLLPPYTLNVSDYYNGTNEKLVLLLTNTDLNKPTLQVRLRMSIQGQAAKLISRDNVYYPAITLDGGVPTRITLGDLAPYFNADNLIFEGITRAQYVQSGKLPEGFYQFCFEAVEVNSNQVVGRSSCAMAWISLSDPPLLNLPRKTESIVYKDPQNIIFQWTPRNYNSPTSAFNTEYEFTLVEIWDNGLAPEAAFGTAQPLYRTTTQATTLLYGPGEPLLLSGHKYAWRVRAQQTDGSSGSDAWRNNGYSEIYWFNCQSDCAPPLNVQHELSAGRATITWSANPNQTSFTVDYREKGQDGSTWYNSATTANRMMLYDLKKDKTYEYRVGGTCDNGITYTYSDIKTLVMAGTDSAVNTDCGVLVAEANIKNRTPIQTLLTGDVITAGDFPVKLLQVSGQSAFTGAGYVTVPFLGQSRVKVKFNGITVNTDKQLIGGVIETTYDPKESQIGNLDEVIDGGGGVGIVVKGIDTAGYYIDMVIPDARNIDVELNKKVDSAGNSVPGGGATLTITGSDGTTKQVKVEELPATIKDKSGTVYGVDKDGNVSKVASSEPMNMTAAQLNSLQIEKAVVKFLPHENQLYAFDEYQPVYSRSNLFSEEYEKLNGDYYVNSKAIVEAQADVVKAVVEIKDNSIIVDSIRFVTGKGTRYESTLLADSVSWEIKIVGGPAADAQELYALYPQGGGKFLSLGKLFIAAYPARTFKVVLVPVNGATVNKDAISSQLDKIYKPVGITFQVTQDKSFDDKSWDLHKDDKLAVSGSGWLSTLTDEMKALNSAYSSARAVQQDAVYLFVMSGSDSTIAGDMPRGKQFGYLFNGADGKVAAHEIGHGLFSLKHVFDNNYGFKQGELPSNVMDYPAGDRFAKHQWDLMYKPGVVIGLFESDGDGQLKITSVEAFKDLKNAKTNTYTFLSPGGAAVTLPATTTNIVLSEANYFMPKEDSKFLNTIPFGTLISFTLQNGDKTEQYTAVGTTSTRTFKQYQCNSCEGGKGKVYIDKLTAKETEGNVILAWPCFDISSEDANGLSFNVKANWYKHCDDAFEASKTNPNYVAGGKFSDAEKILIDAAYSPRRANCDCETCRKIFYTISGSAVAGTDFHSERARSFIKYNTDCESRPYPAVMNIANLIQLNEADFEEFVTSREQNKTILDFSLSRFTYNDVLASEEDYENYLEAFQEYLKTGKKKLNLADIKDSDEMEAALGDMIWDNYPSLTSAERIQILKVLTQKSNWINSCLFRDGMRCEEAQLITVIKTIPDQKQAQEVGDYLNANLNVLLRLVYDVDDSENGADNHEEMMKALYGLCQLKDIHGSELTAGDLEGQRLHYKSTFDYGAFTLTSTITGVNFDKPQTGQSPAFSIPVISNQVFSQNTPGSIKEKYTVNLYGNNGFAWISKIKPLDNVVVVFGEDFKLTNGDQVFSKGDIVRIPALYLWQLYQIDAKQTAARVRGSAIKFAVNGAALLAMGVAEGATAKVFATLDFASTAYTTIVSPALLRQNLSPQVKEIVEGFDALGQFYMLYRLGEGGVEVVKLFKNYRLAYLEKVKIAKASASATEKPAVETIDKVVNSVEGEGGQVATDPASSPQSGASPAPSQGQTATGGQSGTKSPAPAQGETTTQSNPATQGPSNTQGQTGTPARPAENAANVENTSAAAGGTNNAANAQITAFESWLRQRNLKGTQIEDLLVNAGDVRAALMIQIGGWEASLLEKLNLSLESFSTLASELIAEPALINYWHDAYTKWWYKYAILREAYRPSSTIRLRPGLQQSIEDLTSLAGVRLSTINPNNRISDLGNIFEDDLIAEVGRGFRSNGNFDHLPPSLKTKMESLWSDGYRVMLTQSKLNLTPWSIRNPQPDLLFFKTRANGRIVFTDVIYIDGKITPATGFSGAQKDFTSLAGTGKQVSIFDFAMEKNPEIFAMEQYDRNIDFLNQPFTLKEAGKIGTEYKNNKFDIIYNNNKMNLNSFEKGLRKELNKWFSEKGFNVFEKVGFAYVKEQKGYIDYVFIRLGAKTYLHELYAQVSMGRRIESIENYWEEYADLLEIRGGMRLTMSIDEQDERGVSQLAITLKDDDPEAVAKARDYIIQTFENIVYPKAESLTDIKELDRVYNDVPDTKRYGSIEMWFKKMAIAKLAGNENYQKILNLFLTIHQEAIQVDPENKVEYENLIYVAGEVDKKLNNVLPLNDPKAIV